MTPRDVLFHYFMVGLCMSLIFMQGRRVSRLERVAFLSAMFFCVIAWPVCLFWVAIGFINAVRKRR
jgi:hypothetical protein